MKSNIIQMTNASFGVLMDLGDDIVFLVYSYSISYKGLNIFEKINLPNFKNLNIFFAKIFTILTKT